MTSIVMEEYELLGDSKYRSYMSQVDKALKSFEYTTEWADLIAALGKLNKVLLGHMKYPIIPRRIVISKRLAQCMHPSLPSGVHIKALETYDIIFKCMGTNRLAQDLFIYSSGLFPLLGNAAMHVRPKLLTVYETHFVPLGERLRPALNGFLSGVLPGLEEGSDYYARTNRLLESVCDASGPPVFYSSMWQCIASNQSVRLQAITFILQHIDKKATSLKSQSDIVGTDLEVVIRAIVEAVEDGNILVQRTTLDLLINLIPFHEKEVSESELVDVLTSACGVLLRRDMSLNRRLFNWLLGNEVSSSVLKESGEGHKTHSRKESSSSILSSDSGSAGNPMSFYFEFYSKFLLIEALRNVLRKSLESESQPNLKPYRLLTTLLDKAEIGPLIIDDVILDVFRTIFHAFKSDEKFNQDDLKSAKQDLIKGVNLLLGTFESNYIWEFCGDQFERASEADDRINDSHFEVNNIGTEETTVIEMCALIDFLLDVVSCETYVDTLSKHLPHLFKTIVRVLTQRCDRMSTREITKALQLTKKLLSKFEPGWTAWDAHETTLSTSPSADKKKTSSEEEETAASEVWTSVSKDLDKDKRETSPEIAKEATESLHTSPVNKNNNVYKQHKQLMMQCAESFENLFVALMKNRVYSSNCDLSVYMTLMARLPNDSLEERTRNLERLLSEVTEGRGISPESDGEVEAKMEKLKTTHVPTVDENALLLMEDAIAISCNILVALSSIPTVGRTRKEPKTTPEEKDNNFYDSCDPADLPEWLQYLIVGACFLTGNLAAVQLQCINTLLDLLGILQSTMMVSSSSSSLPIIRSSSQPEEDTMHHKSNVVIIMMALIEEEHYNCIMRRTVITQVIASQLWDGLGNMPPVLHLKCVTLLHQLHNLVPCPSTVERILARSLCNNPKIESTDTVDAHQKFTLLWHLGRDLENKADKNSRTFDVCLLKMLDNLNMASGPLKALSQSWLVHAMAKNDIGRLMEPLLLTLLDPSTARISVLHAKIEHLESVDSTDGKDQHDIYAISNNSGEIFYHVSSDKLHKESADKAKRNFALNTFRKKSPPLIWSPQFSQRKPSISSRSGSTSLFSITDLNSIPLSVNPFALVPPDFDEYSSFTRGYPFSSQKNAPSNGTESTEQSHTDNEDTASLTESTRASSRISIAKLFGDDEVDNNTSEDEKSTSSKTAQALNILEGGASNTTSPKRPNKKDTQKKFLNIHPLHSHLLLYCNVCDSKQILYTMQCIKNIITTNPRLAICTLSTTSLRSSESQRSHQIQKLLARHRKSVFGKSFVGHLMSEDMTMYRNSTLVEVLMSTLLYFLRSFYPNLGQARLSEEEIQSNREVQVMSIDILSEIVSELVSIVQENSKGFATYICDLFARCKVQKVVLHSLLACINDMKDHPKKKEEQELLAFTDDILSFNDILSKKGETNRVTSDRISSYSEAFQVQVLRLLLNLVMLEQAICYQRGEPPDKMRLSTAILESGSVTPAIPPQSGSSNVLRYHNDHIIPDQPMFLAAIVSALRQEKMRHLHSHWTSLVTSCLPFLGKALSQSVLEITAQLSRNLEQLAPFYASDEVVNSHHVFGRIPADYVVTQLEALTMIYHYCILDSSQSSAAFPHPVQQQSQLQQQQQQQQIQQQQQQQQKDGNSEILTNLLHVFLSNADTKQLATKSLGATSSLDSLTMARKILLSTLPRLMHTVAILWQCLNSARQSDAACVVLVGAPRIVRKSLKDLISPIAHTHPVPFLSAVGVVWQERRGSPINSSMNKPPLPSCNEDQKVLVEIVSEVKTMPVSTVINTSRQVLKSPPSVSSQSGAPKFSVDAAVLQFLYAYLAQCSTAQIQESWSGLAQLLRECLNLAPPAIFLALSIVNQFVQRSQPLPDRKDQKELQDLTGKLVDGCANIGGSCLEQTNWLRRNLAVNSDLQQETMEGASDKESENGFEVSRKRIIFKKEDDDNESRKSLSQFAVPALALLGELLAPLLDIIFSSEEKDKMLPMLYNVMYNVIPYLRNHSRSNQASFRACSMLLASLSEYQYTRKAWRKEAFELLLDPSFFQMDLISLQSWRNTIENLMTHDKTTFKELMTKVSSSISQSGSLSLFSSKEQELEQRALLLKRLAFVIFCSDEDQYHKQMPDIQERLAESLRTIPTSPAVQSAVFLCFRVILVRMSPHHVTSLWPLIITEMVQIFSYLEQELLTDSEEWSSHLKRLSTLDTSWVVSAGSNGLAAHNSPQWMALYLAVCKLLDLALALPASSLPQFQMYRWAFVSDGELPESHTVSQTSGQINGGATSSSHGGYIVQDFVPYVVRVARILLKKMSDKVTPAHLTPGQPQLTMTSIQSLDDLTPFFASICENVTKQQAKRSKSRGDRVFRTVSTSADSSSTSSPRNRTMEVVNAIIERDFLESLVC